MARLVELFRVAHEAPSDAALDGGRLFLDVFPSQVIPPGREGGEVL